VLEERVREDGVEISVWKWKFIHAGLTKLDVQAFSFSLLACLQELRVLHIDTYHLAWRHP
jgi:hypothetical protein